MSLGKISKSRIAKLAEEGRGLRGTFAAKTMSENQLQQAVARLLDHSGLIWCHPPNGGNRTARTGALMKSMGAKAGVPDVLIFNGIRSTLLQSWVGMAIELKVGKNKPTPAQLKWHEDLRACGWRVDVCRTDDEVLVLGAGAPDVIRHAAPPPPAAGPDEAAPYDMGVTGREGRIVDDAYTGDPDAPIGPPVLDAWVRFADLPEDPALHVGLLAQFTGHLSIAAALRPHAALGQDAAHRTLSTGINAIALSVHADVHADRWMRYHHHSTFAGDGMTHAECRVYDEPGDLLASFPVDAMVRPFADAGAPVDERTAL